MKPPSPCIAVICRPSPITKRILLGIASYTFQQERWSISPFERLEAINQRTLEHEFLGVIVLDEGTYKDELVDSLYQKIPTIIIGSGSMLTGFPRITVDAKAISKIAVTTFLNRGFRSIAYVGRMNHENSKILKKEFCAQLQEIGINPFVFVGGSVGKGLDGCSEIVQSRMMEWMSSLPSQTGVFAADDTLAFELVQAANRLGICIPDELAILGVNDDDLLCKIARPSLSSIRLPLEKMGFDAAKLLQKILSDPIEGNANHTIIPYAPMGLIARGSTKVVAVSDAIVRAAVSYIHENFMHPINVESILEELNVSRSLLERRFRVELGTTPLVELRRQRIERARALLSDTNETIHDMGKRCGFSSVIRFTTVFKEQVGVTPSAFRKQMVPNANVRR